MARYFAEELAHKQTTLSAYAKKAPKADTSADEVSLLLMQANICCEEARYAAVRHRLQAACGLFLTAIALYKMLLQDENLVLDAKLRLRIEEQLHHIENEMQIHAELRLRWRSL